MQDYFIVARAKRIADQYGEWIKKGYQDRKQRLDTITRDIKPEKIKEMAMSLIKYRYNE